MRLDGYASSSQVPCNQPRRAGNGGWEKTRWQMFYVDVKEFVIFCGLKKNLRSFLGIQVDTTEWWNVENSSIGVDVRLDTAVGDQRVVNLSSDLYDFFLIHIICKRKRR